MIDSRYRKVVQPAFDLGGKALVKLRLTPNQVTVLALLLGVAAGVCVALQAYLVAGVLLALSGLMDVLDGTVARLTKKSSKLGAFWDMVFDRLVESAIVLGFYFALPEFSFFYLLFFVSVVFNFATFSVAGALMQNMGEKSMHYDPGLAERTETFITFGLMLLFPSAAGYLLLAFTLLIFVTGIIRFYHITKIMKDEEDEKV